MLDNVIEGKLERTPDLVRRIPLTDHLKQKKVIGTEGGSQLQNMFKSNTTI